MPQILVQFEESTLAAIDRLAPAAKRKRTEFIRQAVKDAIFRHEQQKMRASYLGNPDSAEEAELCLSSSAKVQGSQTSF